jgi:hypothetical protein
MTEPSLDKDQVNDYLENLQRQAPETAAKMKELEKDRRGEGEDNSSEMIVKMTLMQARS